MKIFIFESVNRLTGQYHHSGGLVIIADNQEQAKDLIKDDSDIAVSDEEWNSVEIFELKDETKPKYWIFPDAGCC